MKKQGISQETLKIIACVTMLIDHIGATLVIMLLMRNPLDSPAHMWLELLYNGMRIIGRIAFPIYCFLLVEGADRTRNPRKYALRLFIGMLLSEIPFDLAFSPTWMEYKWKLTTPLLGFNPEFNSVMMTLLLGFGMLQCMKRAKGFWKAAVILPFYILAEVLDTDYSGTGILLIAVFALTRGTKYEKLLCILGCTLILNSGMKVQLFGIWINTELFALLALIPVFRYDGRKLTHSKAAQWGFYLFYPVHILILALLKFLIFDSTPLIRG